METKQPVWKYRANLGDRNPIAFGGLFVYEDETGTYPAEAELLEVPDDEEDTWYVYRFSLDRLEQVTVDDEIVLVPYGFSSRSDLPYSIADYETWFNDSLDSIAWNSGFTPAQLREMLCSEDTVQRASAYEAIGQYHGFENLDSYPLMFEDRNEIELRYQNKNS